MKHLGFQDVKRDKVVRPTVGDITAARRIVPVNQQLRVDRPNQPWVSGFTYVSSWQGWCLID